MNKLSIQQNTTQNTSTQNTENTKKETSWLSKNIHLVCGAALLAISLPILWKLGAAAHSTSPQQHSWIPLTEADTPRVDTFDPVDHTCGTNSPFDKKIIQIALQNGDSFRENLKTLFHFCVKNNVGNYAKDNIMEGCAERSFSALKFNPEILSEDGFQSYFPTLTMSNGQWMKKI